MTRELSDKEIYDEADFMLRKYTRVRLTEYRKKLDFDGDPVILEMDQQMQGYANSQRKAIIDKALSI